MIGKRKWLCVGSMLAMTTATPALAQTAWTGSTSTDWFNADNWSSGVPDSSTAATIDTQTHNATVINGNAAQAVNVYVGSTAMNTGTLTINNGGTLSLAGSASIGDNGSDGNVTVDGAGSSLTAANGWVAVGGYQSQSTLTIKNGGVVSTIEADIGGSSSVGNAIVDGAGSALTTTTTMYIGYFNGTGTLTLSNGGVATASDIIMGYNGGSATVIIGAAPGEAAVAPGTLNVGTVNNISGTVSTIVFNHTSSNYTFAPIVTGLMAMDAEAGTTILTAANTYTGATTVNGGTLQIDGSIAGSAVAVNNSGTFVVNGTITDSPVTVNDTGTVTVNGSVSNSLITVNSGGTLGGSGTVGDVQINAGATLAPGNGTPNSSLNMTSGLTLPSGSIYLVQVNPTTASYANVTGTATLGGASVHANFANGTYVAKQYKILTASDAVSGTFNSTVVSSNQPSNIKTSLSYDAHNAYLDLALNFVISGGLNTNQQNVANALTQSFNANGGIATTYATLSSPALKVISSQTATIIQQATTGAVNQFMNTMTSSATTVLGSPSKGVSSFADEDAMAYAAKRNPNDALAAIHTKAAAPATLEQRWNVWAAGFGGSQTTDGNATLGSSDTTSRIYGTAVGANYRFSPYTVAGFALAGGGTNFSAANSGTGRSDMFQAGAFVRHDIGAAYLSGALAYGWQDVTTDRTLTIAGVDQLRGRFNLNTYSGRIEGGYRFVAPVVGGVGFTPYAAGQFTTLDLPAYAESVLAGTNAFALAYNSKSVTDSRSELGVRTDKSYAMNNAILTLTGRAAWAHDFNPNSSINATFQALPGASFVINGAAQASESALVTAAAEVKWTNGWSTAATFEGEFSNVTRSYAGKALVRYAW